MQAPSGHTLVPESDPNISDTETRQAQQPLAAHAPIPLTRDRASAEAISGRADPQTGLPARQIEPRDAQD